MESSASPLKLINVQDKKVSTAFAVKDELGDSAATGLYVKSTLNHQLGRLAANKALKHLDVKDTPVPKANSGEPVWPAGIIGSISHSGDWGVCAVAFERDLFAIGIDLQIIKEIKDISSRIGCESELEWINRDMSLKTQRTLMLFSAKESIYKAFYPRCRKWFGFKDVMLNWDSASSGFSCILKADLSDHLCKGYRFKTGCKVWGGYIFSATVIKNNPRTANKQ